MAILRAMRSKDGRREGGEVIKRIVATLAVIIMLTGCHEVTKNYGGTMTLDLPEGQKLEEITWKDSDLWYLTRPMRENEKPETHLFKADTEWGVFEGQVIIREHGGKANDN